MNRKRIQKKDGYILLTSKRNLLFLIPVAIFEMILFAVSIKADFKPLTLLSVIIFAIIAIGIKDEIKAPIIEATREAIYRTEKKKTRELKYEDIDYINVERTPVGQNVNNIIIYNEEGSIFCNYLSNDICAKRITEYIANKRPDLKGQVESAIER